MNMSFEQKQSQLVVNLTGSFERADNPSMKEALFRLAWDVQTQRIVIHAQTLETWDSSLVVVLYTLKKIALERGISFQSSTLPKQLNSLLDLALTVDRKPPQRNDETPDFLEVLGTIGINTCQAIGRGLIFIRDVMGALGRFFTKRVVMRSVDFWTELDNCGPKAVLIVSLISFMVGLILAFVGAIQLKTFGAQIFVASLVTIGMIRIMGAIMVGIIMAGRTGASYAATIGTMQVNEELDALKTMGIPVTDFLILPRLVTLVIAMPILVLLADFMGMLGGAFVGVLLLDIPAGEYWKYAWEAFGLTNFLVGLFHGLVFGFVIGLCGCYYGVQCGRNADSVGIATTKAVVWSIVWMIVLTGLITYLCEVIGI